VDGSLVLSALKNNPEIRTYDLPAYDTTITVEITMKAEDAGQGRVGWGLKAWWGRDMDQKPSRFEVQETSSWQTCRTGIVTDESLTRLDLYPLQGTGKVLIHPVVLKDMTGQVLKEWSFGGLQLF
jgi:hypothetical protein